MVEMKENLILLWPVLWPVAAGVGMLLARGLRDRKELLRNLLLGSLVLELALLAAALLSGGNCLNLLRMNESFSLRFVLDGVGRLFAVLMAVVWFLVGIHATSYMAHEHKEYRFYGYYLIVLGVMIGLDFAGNLITLYVFYELMTLTALPLVLHEGTKEAVWAGLKFLFFSVAGAFLALFGIFFLITAGGGGDFTPGGMAALAQGALAGKEGLLLASVFCMIVGFGTKAGMFPLHGWLPTAHPVAPAPASAVLSGVITKAGVLCIIRVVYYVVGPEAIRGTWLQQLWILLTLLTVFMGSMLAYREPVLKKRLAYSTVSQVSYVLFGLSVLEPTAFAGALSHVVFHSVIKDGLFLCAGSMILSTGMTRVEDLKGLGRTVPVLLGAYTVVSLALIGIPPASGFVSKWYLATGALDSGTGVWAYAGPAVLLVSALLTAGYLLPLTIQGFFPGDAEVTPAKPVPIRELAPVLILAAASLLFGCFPGPLLSLTQGLAVSVL